MEHNSKFLTEAEAAMYLNISVKTVQAWRIQGKGPQFRKFSRCVRYHLTDLENYADECIHQNTTERIEQ